jgi:hypothetical protein
MSPSLFSLLHTTYERRAGALPVGNDVFFNSHGDQILDLAARTAWLSCELDISWD